MAAQTSKKRPFCTQTSEKQTPDARTSSTLQGRRSSGKDKVPRMNESTMTFRALGGEGQLAAERPKVSKSSRSRENTVEKKDCNLEEIEPDRFVFSASELSLCEEDL